jgi:hypothetical protein
MIGWIRSKCDTSKVSLYEYQSSTILHSYFIEQSVNIVHPFSARLNAPK